MNSLYHNFKNHGLGAYNDDVLDNQEFDIKNNKFSITISPIRSTKFWRFGFAFSENRGFEFAPAAGRYNDNTLKFVEIDVGEYSAEKWGKEARIQVGTYYIANDHQVSGRHDSYQTGASVELELSADENGLLQISGGTAKNIVFNEIIEIGKHRYFKLFAWADFSTFELDCFIQQKPGTETSTFLNITNNSNANHWLFKPDRYSLELDGLAVGDEVVIEGRDDAWDPADGFENIGSIKEDDKLLGLSTSSYLAVPCAFLVTEIGPYNNGPGTRVTLKVIRIFTPWVSYLQFRHRIPFNYRLRFESPVSCISLTPDVYDFIVSCDYQFPQMRLSEDQRRYLEIIFQNFMQGTVVESPYAIPEMWKELPPEFLPSSLDSALVRGDKEITLYGISQIHPEFDLFAKFDRIIYTVKEILSKGTEIKNITSESVLEYNNDFGPADVFMLFKLMGPFRSLTNGMGTGPGFLSTIHVGETNVLETYRKYNGLKILMAAFVRENAEPANIIYQDNGQTGRNESSETGNASGTISATPIKRHKRSDMLPVMNVSALATDLANIIMELHMDKGQMIGIFGKWGRGKTYLMNEIWKVLAGQEKAKYIKINYDAWKYQETPASWAYLYEVIADKYLNKKKGFKNWFAYQWRLYRLNYKRFGKLPILKNIFAIISIFAANWFAYKNFGKGGQALGITIPASLLLLLALLYKNKKEFSTRAVALVKKYTIRQTYKNTMGIQADIQDELIKLLKAWIPKRKLSKRKIILFVDDIDRCDESNVMRNIDALRVMLEDKAIAKRLIVVTAIDERILKKAIFKKYATLFDETKKTTADDSFIDQLNVFKANADKAKDTTVFNINELVNEYLDKLFISAIKLGDISREHRSQYVNELLKNQERQSDVTPATEIKRPDSADASSNNQKEASAIPTPNFSSETVFDNTLSGVTANEDIPADFEKLTDFESAAIREIIIGWRGITPRKIDIFYYRYLLCKNLLINTYVAQNRQNPWATSSGIRALLNFMKYFIDNHNDSMVSAKKDKISNADHSEGVGYNLFGMENWPPKDCQMLLEIFEMAIAY